jgi:hypothetical protein
MNVRTHVHTCALSAAAPCHKLETATLGLHTVYAATRLPGRPSVARNTSWELVSILSSLQIAGSCHGARSGPGARTVHFRGLSNMDLQKR